MAIKSFCDKCKKEIVENKCQLILTSSDIKQMGESFDLCANCFRELKAKWLEWMPK